MNKWLKKGILILSIGCLALSATGCKADKIMDKVLEKTDPKPMAEENDIDAEEKKEVMEFDVAKPEFTVNLEGSVTYQTGAEAEALTVEAQATDEGTISYQWYKSKTNTNGGGTKIEGATAASFVPPTDEAVTLYYYAVAISSIEQSSNSVTSETKEVIVTNDVPEPVIEAAGQWKQDDKGWWYQKPDGSFPKGQWMKINDKWYVFDGSGYMKTGWYKEGETWYYLKTDGSMAVDTDVEGYHIGPDGKMQ